MCSLTGGIVVLVLGAILVFTSSFVGYGLVDGFISNMIANEFVLFDNTTQMERFEEVPFPVNFTIRVFNITNKEAVLAGAIPVVNEVGPYIYKFYQTRVITDRAADTVEYHQLDWFEFDAEASFPLTEQDQLTIANVPYHAILQVAEAEFPQLLAPLSMALNGVFGELNAPVVTVGARRLFLDGLPICASPGLLGFAACAAIRAIAVDSQNMAIQPDNSILFSIVGYKDGLPSPSYRVLRGVDRAQDMARIVTFDGSARLRRWPEGDAGSVAENDPNVCNMLNGTDSGLQPPLLQRHQSVFAFNSDICRSVELHYQNDLELSGVPASRFSIDERFLANHEGCFCLNLTRGLTAPDGCLLSGALELYSCVGAFLVLSNPHFLYADPVYQNGVIGMTPDESQHRTFMELDLKTGTILRGAAKAQFNVFMRPISQISGTDNLTTVLTPIFWIDEGLTLPEEYVNDLKDKLLAPLRLVDILVPVIVAVSCTILLLGIFLTVRASLNRPREIKTR